MPFDKLTRALDGGLRPGELCLVAGYTSHGKSILVDQIADSAASAGRKVHLYMTEMTAYQRGLRLLSRRARLPFRQLKRRDLTSEHWTAILTELSTLPYGCSIVSDWTVDEMVDHIRENQWDLAVVDLVHGFHYTDERELSKTSSALMRATKGSTTSTHAGTAIVAAAHLNDGQMRDQRTPVRPRPGLHSIKGSSSLKQDADVVMFVWQIDDEDGRPTGEGAVWIAKSRQGEMDAVEVRLDTAWMQFVPKLSAVETA
jgi:replicative DNA helicase